MQGLSREQGRHTSGDYWEGRINIVWILRGKEWGKKEKGSKILVWGFRRENLIWKIRDLLLDIVTIKHRNHAAWIAIFRWPFNMPMWGKTASWLEYYSVRKQSALWNLRTIYKWLCLGKNSPFSSNLLLKELFIHKVELAPSLLLSGLCCLPIISSTRQDERPKIRVQEATRPLSKW